MENRKLQSRRRTLALVTVPKHVFQPLLCLRLADQAAFARTEFALVLVPPVADRGRIGPREFLVGIHGDIFIFGVVRGTGFNIFRCLPFQFVIDEIDTSDHGQRLAGHTRQLGHGHLFEQPGDRGRVADNAGAVGSLVVNKIAEGKDGFGYNADTDKYEDLMAAGVIDPLKVTRIALQNAASVAGLLLTTDCVVTEKPQKKGPGATPPGGMGDMGGMGGMGGMCGMGDMM